MTTEELLDIFHAEPTRLHEGELIELGKSLGIKLTKRMKESTMIERISEAISDQVEEVEESELFEDAKEDKKEIKTESGLLGTTFKKTISNPLMIKYVMIKDSITITEKHLKIDDFERIFKKQVELGILKQD